MPCIGTTSFDGSSGPLAGVLNKTTMIRYIAILPTLLIFSGCVSFSFLQDSEIQEPGKVGGAVALTNVQSRVMFDNAVVRVGIVPNVDAGARIGVNAVRAQYTYFQFTDLYVRYRVVQTPVRLLLGCAYSNFVLDSSPVAGSDVFVHAFQPSILLGQRYWYFALRPYYSIGSGVVTQIAGKPLILHDRISATAFTLGGVLPIPGSSDSKDIARFFVEINYLRFQSSQSFVQPAIGLFTEL